MAPVRNWWMPVAVRWLCAVVAGAGLMAGMSLLAPAAENERVPRGRRLYAIHCAVCHGERGDGRGMAAHMLAEAPRDFRSGLFKFRSTPTGSLPTDADLLRTLTEGLRWTGMVGRPNLPEADRRALIAFIKTLSPRFAAASPRASIHIPDRPAATPSAVAEGRALYTAAGCDECHGPAGRGNGPAAGSQRDAWGNRTRPSDITWRPLKRGAVPTETYLTIVTGLDGSPMPAYGDVLDPDQVWALVAFLDTLVVPERQVSEQAVLGEERAGWMILRMHGGGRHRMGRGWMP